VYSPKKRAEIGKLVCRVGATEAARRLTKKYGLRIPINESTARKIKEVYLEKRRE